MKKLIKLVIPVALTYFGINLMGFVDLLFVARVHSTAIGAVGFGSSLYWWFLVFGLGLTSSLEYLVSHAHGAREKDRQHHFLSQGLLASLIISIPLSAILYVLSCHVEWFGVNPEVLEAARAYSKILSFSLFPALAFNVVRLYFTAMGIARPAFIMLLFGNVFNAIVDAFLVFGLAGAPRLEVVGAAWATLLSRTFMLIGMLVYLYKWDRANGNRIGRLGWTYHPKMMRELVRLGLPAAFQMTFETGIFALATVMAARLTAQELAAHQIVLNAAGMTFMFPLGVGAATAVLVGQSVGEKNWKEASEVGKRGFIIGTGFMVISALVMLVFAQQILHGFTTDQNIIEIGKSILVIAALFQISDGAQVVGTGALRGLGDTKSAMYLNFIGHWVLGVPMGALLCFYWDWGLKGLWVGLSLGLTAVAFGVFFQWMRKSRHYLTTGQL